MGSFLFVDADREPEELRDGGVEGEATAVLDVLVHLVALRLDCIGAGDDGFGTSHCPSGWQGLVGRPRGDDARKRGCPGNSE